MSNSASSVSEVWLTLECGGPPEDIPLPQIQVNISEKHWSSASSWMNILGRDLVTCIFSKDWNIREIATRRLAREIANALKKGSPSGFPEYSDRLDRIWRCAADVLAKIVEDKVYKVYLSAIKCLRTLLVFTPIQDEAHEQMIRTNCIRPILQTILLKCADGNRRIAELSVETIQEMCKDDNGAMQIGKYANRRQCKYNLDFVLHTILENKDPHNAPWQFILGRLITLDKLVSHFAPDFTIPPGLPSAEQKRDSFQWKRLMSLVDYSFQHLRSSHVNVSKLARTIFLRSADLTLVEEPSTFIQIWKLLSALDPTLQLRLKRKMRNSVKTVSSLLPMQDYMILEKLLYEDGLGAANRTGQQLAAFRGQQHPQVQQMLHQQQYLQQQQQQQQWRPSLQRSTSYSPSRQVNHLERSHSQSPSRFGTKMKAVDSKLARREPDYLTLKKTKFRMKQKLKTPGGGSRVTASSATTSVNPTLTDPNSSLTGLSLAFSSSSASTSNLLLGSSEPMSAAPTTAGPNSQLQNSTAQVEQFNVSPKLVYIT